MKNKMMAVLNVEKDKKIGIVAFDQKEDTVLFCWNVFYILQKKILYQRIQKSVIQESLI